MPEREILWIALTDDPTNERFVEEALSELATMLRSVPIGLSLGVRQLPTALRQQIVEKLFYGQLDACVSIAKNLSSDAGKTRFGLLVFCAPDHPAAQAARRRLPSAAWGLNHSGVLSLVYRAGNKYLLWHEALHLLGAQDHYDPITLEPTCSLKSCLMQYAPSPDSIKSMQCLCDRTISVLRKNLAAC